MKKRAGRNLNVWINSYGGSVFAGAGIYNALKEHSGKVTTIVDGIAASAASVIAMAGSSVEITPVGMLMIHNPMGCMGEYSEAKDFRHMADMLDKVKDTIVTAYVLKTSMSREEISGMMDDESYMTAGEAVRLGFANVIRGVDAEQANIVNAVFRRGKAINADDQQTRDALGRMVAKLQAEKAEAGEAATDAAQKLADEENARASAHALADARARFALRARTLGLQQ
ncbi:MAG: Clp protease ClpP [Eubacteriales bacterium]|nr:Clp protease ClpP [Eubacteriales bacterium]